MSRPAFCLRDRGKQPKKTPFGNLPALILTAVLASVGRGRINKVAGDPQAFRQLATGVEDPQELAEQQLRLMPKYQAGKQLFVGSRLRNVCLPRVIK